MTTDEDLTGPVGDLLAGSARFRELPAPDAGPELRALFAASRRFPSWKRILGGVPAKVAAGALGALLAGSVAAGALTGTTVPTSHDSDAPAVEVTVPNDEVVVVDHDDQSGDEVEHADEAGDDAVDEVEDDGANDAADAVDLAAVPAPASASPAGPTHDADDEVADHEDEDDAADDVGAVDGDHEDHEDHEDETATKAEHTSAKRPAERESEREREASHRSGKGGR